MVGGLLLRGHADPLDVFGQFGLGHGDAVLHEHLGRVEIGPQLEGHVEEHLAVVGAARRHVEHALDAVHFLFDGSGHRGGHGLRVGARIRGRDLDRRRGDVGILGNREACERHQSDDHDHQREDGGENRPIDEEAGKT